MSISGIGSSPAFDPTQMAKGFFKKADANGDGGVDKSELKTMLSQGPGAKDGTGDIDKIFAEVDSNSDGKIDETENENQMKKMSAQGGKPSGGAGGPPPGGGAAKGGATSGSSQTSSTQVYDKKDQNKDGTVSVQEELIYDLSHPSEEKNSQYNQDGNSISGTLGKINLSA